MAFWRETTWNLRHSMHFHNLVRVVRTHIFLICIGLFLQKSPIIDVFFAERDLQLMAHTWAKILYIDFSCVCEVTRGAAATHCNVHCNLQCANATCLNLSAVREKRSSVRVFCEVTRGAAATRCNAHCNLQCANLTRVNVKVILQHTFLLCVWSDSWCCCNTLQRALQLAVR